MQHLMIDGASDKESLRTIVSSCPNVRNLAIHLPLFEGIEWELDYLLPALREMPHLTCLTMAFLSASFLAEPFLNRLTHLHVVVVLTPSFCVGKWEILTHLPKLTHLNVGCSMLVEHVLKLLLSPLLKLLIVGAYAQVISLYADKDALSSVDDNRLVLLRKGNCDDRVLDWEKGANGGMDSWVFAELFVLAQGSE